MKSKNGNVNCWGNPYKLIPKQQLFIEDLDHSFVGIGGGMGNGKTFALCRKAILMCERYSDIRCLLAGYSYENIRKIMIPVFAQALCGEYAKESDINSHPMVEEYLYSPMIIKMKNGSSIRFFRLKNLSCTSIVVKWVGIDDAHEISYEQFIMMYLRTRQEIIDPQTGKDIKSQIAITYDPSNHLYDHKHWIHKFFEDRDVEFVNNWGDNFYNYECFIEEVD